MTDVLPAEGAPFGDRVRRRLRTEPVIWLVTVGADGTPQPNPVWFLWEGGNTVLTYNLPSAYRMTHMRNRPQVSLHFDSDGEGEDIIILKGTAEFAEDQQSALETPAFLEKYREGMVRVTGSPERFSATYSAPVRIRIEKVRGF
ncbi:TIGR03667 family PPOX class F420-dependent oxidoreductase [Amycolatopsis aidingensis]|uniref:TIGR03667 family PPOX class F420-dependent oxidoreductase n=1 Tax=Amycolatopsis aidingensis TaxID=2842453 RepID=UPI001C0AEE7B|nr:TIGR03667 family PPOX class F420-dependent oxidoreductase [Amycolatopsis aidingensis]